MTSPPSIRVEDANRAAKLYHDFHSGKSFLGYAITLTLLTIALAIRAIYQMTQHAFSDTWIVEIGQVVCFGSIFVECLWLYYLARNEDIKITDFQLFRVDAGLFIFSFLLYLIEFEAKGRELSNFLHLVWLIPLTIRGCLLIKWAILGEGYEISNATELTAPSR